MEKNDNVWDDIAESFAKTRKKPWTECLDFIRQQPNTTIMLDLACGNGRHLLPASKHSHIVIGGDKSQKLLDIAQQNTKKIGNISLIRLDATCLPLKKEKFNAILFIASLHNISGKHNRLKALKEIRRVLKPRGNVLITVWARWQPKWRGYFIKQIIKSLIYFRQKNEYGDILIPWKQDNRTLYRFYHLYSKKELANDIKKAGFKIEKIRSIRISTKRHHDNHLILAKK